jgi:hypothetical protein
MALKKNFSKSVKYINTDPRCLENSKRDKYKYNLT